MWKHPWGFKEGSTIACGLLATGLLLQAAALPIRWSLTAYPANVALLAAVLLAVAVMSLLRKKVYLFAWLGGHVSAICSIAACVAVTIVLGLFAQSTNPNDDLGMMHHLLSSWPFVLCYAWLVVSLALTTLRVTFTKPMPWLRKSAFFLNHAGLLVAILCATLGNADLQRLKLTAGLEDLGYGPQAIAHNELTDSAQEMDFAIQLRKFTINEYAPKISVIDSLGRMQPEGNAKTLEISGKGAYGEIAGWILKVDRTVDAAAKMQVPLENDSTKFATKYVAMQLPREVALREGGAYAAHVIAHNPATGEDREGWVSCGSFMPFSFSVLPLDGNLSVAMPDREPKRYASSITVYLREDDHAKVWADTVVEVNKPVAIPGGWKIYQLSYEEELRHASRYSVFELVRDPWLPAVYVGIYMMLLGAVCLMLLPKNTKSPQ